MSVLVSACLTDGADIDKRAGNATEPTLDAQVLSSLSTWFGWQFAGGAKDQNQLVDSCRDTNSSGVEKLKDSGLVPANIRRELGRLPAHDHSPDILAEPSCNMSHGMPNPDIAFPNSIPAVSAIIERQLVGSFRGKEAFAYLCDNLGTFSINQFYLTDSNLLRAVCGRAGQQVPPRPFGTEAGRHLSKAAAFAARNTASILYATLVAAGVESDLELNVLCAHAPEHTANLNAESLNGTLVESTLCSIKAPLTVVQTQHKILSWTSRLFITVLENVGNVDGWLHWLCENLDEEGMNGVGLIGWGSKLQVCKDARTGLSTELVLPEGIPCEGPQEA